MVYRHDILIQKYKQQLKNIGYTTIHTIENRHKALLKFNKREPKRATHILWDLERHYANKNPRMSNIYKEDRMWLEKVIKQ